MGKVGTFIKEVREEMKMVTWPNSQSLRKNTITVFIMIAIFAVFFLGVDYLTTTLLQLLH